MSIKNSLHVPIAGVDVPALISKAISTILHVPESELLDDSSFITVGGDSLSAIKIAAFCHKNGFLLPAGAILHSKRLDDLIVLAVPAPITAPPTPEPYPVKGFSSPDFNAIVDISAATRSSFDLAHATITAEDILNGRSINHLTELQLLLLRGSLNNSSLNMLTVRDTFKGASLDRIKLAWERVLLSEPIFAQLLQDFTVTPDAVFGWRETHVGTQEAFDEQIRQRPVGNQSISSLDVVVLCDGGSRTESNMITTTWRIHHAFVDGYSIQIIRNKIQRALRGEDIPTGPSFDNIVQSIEEVHSSNREAARQFWTIQHNEFASASRHLILSPQRSLKRHQSRTDSLTVRFPHIGLTAIAKAYGITPATFYCAAWALTLSKYTNNCQVCFGIVMSRRDLPIDDILETVGPLINTLPLFVSICEDSTSTARELLLDVSKRIEQLNQFSSSVVEDGFSRDFSSVLAMQFSNGDDSSGSVGTLDGPTFEMESEVPLSIIVESSGQVRLIFNTSYFLRDDMKLLGDIYLRSMHTLLKANNTLSGCLDGLLPARAIKDILEWSNCFSAETFEDSKCEDLVTLFEKAVQSNPDDIAIVQGLVQLTYRELDTAAEAVARALGFIRGEECVCVYADRSINWLIAMYGILKARGVYTPLDPTAPAELRNTNFNRCGARAFLIPLRQTAARDACPKDASQLLYVEDILADRERHSRHVDNGNDASKHFPRRRCPRPDSLAYVCFTSGSTGQPKAVRCTHKGLVAFQKNEEVRLFASPGVTVAQVMSPVFDGSIHEIFSALSYGATLRIAPLNAEDPFGHLHESHSAILTPSIAKVLDPGDFPTLRHVYLVGEQVPQILCDTWGQKLSLYNMYGPTEATCGATIKRLLPDKPVNLGHPNPSTRVYVLDRNLQLSPPGSVGEVFLAGIQVSKGYIGLPEQNANRFLGDTVLPESNEKMYRTGDLGYFEPSTGELYLLGRNDRQIKLRGYRLDLHDLEVRAAKALPMCDGVAIFKQNDYLVAAVKTITASVEMLKSNLSNELPPYAMPRRIIPLAKFPLTSAGKLDYIALKNLEHRQHTNTEQAEAFVLGSTEEAIASAWRHVLKADHEITLNKESNFLSMGGHSILQLKLASRLSTVLKHRINIRTIIENPILSDMAIAISLHENFKSHNEIITSLGQIGVSPIERDWFMKYQADLGSSAFNVSQLFDLESHVDRACLQQAFDVILSRYDILRSIFKPNGDRVERLLFDKPPRTIMVDSVHCRKAINTEFDLSEDYLIRVFITEKQLLVCISHIICDLTTLEVLLQEVATVYNGADTLPPPERLYSETKWSVSVDADTKNFWHRYLAELDHSSRSCLPRPRSSYTGSSKLYKLPAGSMFTLQALSSRQGVTFHQVALALVYLALQTDQSLHTDMVLGGPHFGRSAEDLSTVGLFLQPFPIRIHKPGDVSDIASFVRSVQTSAQSALAHALPWDQLLQVVSQSPDTSLQSAASTHAFPNHALFDVMVTFHDNRISPKLPIQGLQPVLSWAEGAKFGIMFEFTAVNETTLTLRIEYDTDLFSFEQVAVLAKRVSSGLGAMNVVETLAEVEGAMRAVGESPDLVNIPFGTSLSALGE